MSVGISIKNVVKRYGKTTVIPDLSVDIPNGQLFTLLGPSGCGKTTLLRMIAGFNTVEGGDLYFNDVRINDLEPGKRNIGMVFQNYAVFPHMSVRQNVAFGLKNRSVPRGEIKNLTDEFMRLVQIEQYADRKPAALSGGQQQRVALARALVIRPDVLLMDEPLSNLDAKLRLEMREVIRRIQRDVGITTVYVTHDQEEAMAISDRIAVMNQGVIQHIGAPKSIYQRPANLFVATFIGKSNLIHASLERSGGRYTLCLKNGYRLAMDNLADGLADGAKVIISARPEEILVNRDENAGNGIRAKVKDSVFLGLNTHYFVELETGEEAEIIQESQIDSIIPSGSVVTLTLNVKKINLFDAASEKSVMREHGDQA